MSIHTSAAAVELKGVEPRRVYALHSGSAPVPAERVAQVVGPLFDQLAENLRGARVEPGFPAVAAYQGMAADGSVCEKIWVAFTVPGGRVAAPAPAGVDYFELPGVEEVASLTHRGDIASLGQSWMALQQWVAEHGFRPSGLWREVYLKDLPYPRDEWVTELQIPIERVEE